MASVAQPRTLRPGAVVFSQGQPPDYMYAVRKGELKVIVSTAGGVLFEACVLGRGDLFGEVGVLQGGIPRSASVVTDSAVELLALSRLDIATRAPSAMVTMEAALRCARPGEEGYYAGQRELAQQYRSALRWERYKAAVVREAKQARGREGRRQGITYRFVPK